MNRCLLALFLPHHLLKYVLSVPPRPQEEERLELFNRQARSGAATPFDVPLPYTGASGVEVRLGAARPCMHKLTRSPAGCCKTCAVRVCCRAVPGQGLAVPGAAGQGQLPS
jgi:hypothetical protein